MSAVGGRGDIGGSGGSGRIRIDSDTLYGEARPASLSYRFSDTFIVRLKARSDK